MEFEVHLTADKPREHLVVIHDDTVDRTTDGTGLVRGMTLPEIKRLDAGYEFTDDGKTGVTVSKALRSRLWKKFTKHFRRRRSTS